MRILHTSDWHLGIYLHGISLLDEQEAFIETLPVIIKENNIEAVVISGDIFDHAISNPEAINLYNKAMTILCMDEKIPVLICAGNHDGAERLSSCNELLKKSGLYISGRINNEMKPIILGDTAFHLLPFFNAEEVRSIFTKETIRNYPEAMTTVINSIKANIIPNKSNILISHCYVNGAELCDSDRSAMVGGTNAVNADIFEGFDYIALGHLHRAQPCSDKVKVYYSGSPIKYSFSEANHIKSFSIIDTTDMSITTLPINPLHDMRILKGTYEEILGISESNKGNQDYIKIELTDTYIGLETQETFRNFYPNLLCMAGKSLEADNQITTLTIDEIAQLSPKDILLKFYLEICAAEPNEGQLKWFDKAIEAIEAIEAVEAVNAIEAVETIEAGEAGEAIEAIEAAGKGGGLQ